MAIREEVLGDSRKKLRTSVPKLLINLFIAVLIWLFGQLVFIPLAQSFELFGFSLAPIVALIVVVALVVALVRAAFDIRDTADALAGIAAVSMSRKTTDDAIVKDYRAGFRGLLYVIYGVLIYLLFYTFMAAISPALAGVALIVLVVWALVVLFQVGGGFSKGIEEWSARAVNRLEQLQATDSGVRVEPRPTKEEGGSGRKKPTD